MLRHIVGDADFFRGISLYLQRHAFGAVESADLEAALREASGRNLRPFFEDWIRGGGGHPSFVGQLPVRARAAAGRSQHPAGPRRPAFRERVPPAGAGRGRDRGRRARARGDDRRMVDAGLAARGRPAVVRRLRQGRLAGERDPAGAAARGGPAPARRRRAWPRSCGRPARSPSGSRGAPRPSPRWPRSSPIPARTGGCARRRPSTWDGWAARRRWPRSSARRRTPTRARAARWLTASPRRAARPRTPRCGGWSRPTPRRTWWRWPRPESGSCGGAGRPRVPRAPAPARVVLVGCASSSARSRAWPNLKDPGLGPVFERYVDPRYSRHLRQAALEGWITSAPDDPRLPARLRELARDRNLVIRDAALGALGRPAPRRGRGVPPRVRRGGAG